MVERQSVLALVPGLVVLLATAILAFLSSQFLRGLDPIILSILIGMAVGNLLELPETLEDGIDTHKLWLETGIVVLGATVTVDQIAASGTTLLALIVGIMGFSLLFVELLSSGVFGFDRKISSLLAAGMSVCGVSAVIAVAGSIRAKSETIAYVVTAIVVFDTVTLFAYPAVGSLLGLSDRVFGIWAGVSMLSTGPATAAGFAYSPVAGEWATVSKITRNAFIGFVAVIYTIVYANDTDVSSYLSYVGNIWTSFPKFVVGFLVLMAMAAAGVFPDAQIETLTTTYTWLFMVAFAGLGYDIDVREMRGVGGKPLVLMLVALCTISGVSLLTISALF